MQKESLKESARAPSLLDLPMRLADHVRAHTAIWLAIVIVVCCCLSAGIAVSKRPWVDESWFTSIAYNVIHRGVMGMTILDPRGFIFAPLVRDIDRYTFWVMPGYVFLQVAWIKLFGLHLVAIRFLSILWIPVALGSCYYIVSRLTENRIAGLLAALVLAADQHFIIIGSTARMDMVGGGLSLLGPALYLRLRERFHRAVFVSCTVLALGIMTHPNAAFGAMFLALIALWFDWDRIRWKTVGIAAAPFVVAIGLWSIYVLQDLEIARSQMAAQAKVPHRFVFDWNIFEQYRGEFLRRYAPAYRLRSDSMLVKLTGTPILLYFASLVALGAIPSLRRRRGVLLLFIVGVAQFTLLSCMQDNAYYLIYVLPAFAAAVGVMATWLWDQRAYGKIAACFIITATVALNTAVIGYRILHNEYANRYDKAIAYLKKNAKPGDLIMGSGEIAFDLGFGGEVIDDSRIGYTSGKRPNYVVLEAFYYKYWIPYLAAFEPPTFHYIRNLLEEDFEKVYDQSQDGFRTRGTFDLPYVIYKRKGID